MPKRQYTVLFERGDVPSQWVASVKEIPQCHTFGRGLAQTRVRIREALRLWEGEKAKTAEVREVLPLPAAAKRILARLQDLSEQLELAMRERDEVVAALQREAWSTRDIAAVLDLSHQRVNQLQAARATARRRRSSPASR